MNTPNLWSRILVIAGSIAVLVGALDPMEGSVVILPGSGLVALGTFLGHYERRWIVYRVWMFILVAFGVAALWGLSQWGGVGGNSGRSAWWLLLVMPYPIGWSLGIWGPGSPRWVLALGVVIGAFYLIIFAFMFRKGGPLGIAPGIFLGALGLMTIIGCFYRSRIRPVAHP